jgi:hypothetical protein
LRLSSGSVPHGLTLPKRTGIISGTPSDSAVTPTFTVKVTDKSHPEGTIETSRHRSRHLSRAAGAPFPTSAVVLGPSRPGRVTVDSRAATFTNCVEVTRMNRVTLVVMVPLAAWSNPHGGGA